MTGSAPAPRRGEVWWVDLGTGRGSAPAGRRPALVVSSDRFNESRIRTVVIAAITSNLRLAAAPGNVRLETGEADLERDSVVNVSQLAAVDRAVLLRRSGAVTALRARQVDDGLRLVLGL